VAATIGPDDIGVYDSPLPDLLREVAGAEPVAAGTHVMLDGQGVRSAQRLAIGDVGGQAVAALWPAELKEQALYLYGQGLGRPMIATARDRGWSAEASPHLAFRNSSAHVRLYMKPDLDAGEYARRWEEGDLRYVGAYAQARVREELWPWLKSRGYVTDADEGVLDEWLATRLGNRPAFLRPGLRLTRPWPRDERPSLAAEIRAGVNAILAAAGDPPLRTTRAGERPVAAP
jgi:hypothetical protein